MPPCPATGRGRPSSPRGGWPRRPPPLAPALSPSRYPCVMDAEVSRMHRAAGANFFKKSKIPQGTRSEWWNESRGLHVGAAARMICIFVEFPVILDRNHGTGCRSVGLFGIATQGLSQQETSPERDPCNWPLPPATEKSRVWRPRQGPEVQ